MSKKDAYKKMIPLFVKLLNRYVEEVLKEDSAPIQKKAEVIYQKMYQETPEIGGAENPMADNLYDFMTFCAYYEASEHRINESSVPYLQNWMMEGHKAAGKLLNLNKKSSVWLANAIFKIMVNMTKKKKARGEWGNTWKMEMNPKGYKEGVSYVLYGCPLLAFAKAHGYEKMMPTFCKIDHATANLLHAKLIRFETESTGGSCCDYWFVGDQSEMAKKYADLPQI